jgi:hypothetical protein
MEPETLRSWEFHDLESYSGDDSEASGSKGERLVPANRSQLAPSFQPPA